MTEQEQKERLVRIARFMLSRLFSLAASVRVVSLDFTTGRAEIVFNPSEADVALLSALKDGAA